MANQELPRGRTSVRTLTPPVTLASTDRPDIEILRRGPEARVCDLKCLLYRALDHRAGSALVGAAQREAAVDFQLSPLCVASHLRSAAETAEDAARVALLRPPCRVGQQQSSAEFLMVFPEGRNTQASPAATDGDAGLGNWEAVMKKILMQELDMVRSALHQSTSAIGAGDVNGARRHLLELRTSCIVLADLLDCLREPDFLRRRKN
jgi:hypothetical protein